MRILCGGYPAALHLVLEILDLALVVVHVVVAAQQLLADGPVVVAGVLVRTPRLGAGRMRKEEEGSVRSRASKLASL